MANITDLTSVLANARGRFLQKQFTSCLSIIQESGSLQSLSQDTRSGHLAELYLRASSHLNHGLEAVTNILEIVGYQIHALPTSLLKVIAQIYLHAGKERSAQEILEDWMVGYSSRPELTSSEQADYDDMVQFYCCQILARNGLHVARDFLQYNELISDECRNSLTRQLDLLNMFLDESKKRKQEAETISEKSIQDAEKKEVAESIVETGADSQPTMPDSEKQYEMTSAQIEKSTAKDIVEKNTSLRTKFIRSLLARFGPLIGIVLLIYLFKLALSPLRHLTQHPIANIILERLFSFLKMATTVTM